MVENGFKTKEERESGLAGVNLKCACFFFQEISDEELHEILQDEEDLEAEANSNYMKEAF